jgi:hypothetical protein
MNLSEFRNAAINNDDDDSNDDIENCRILNPL